MKLILASFLRTLRERDQFDRLLPELVAEMGYIPKSKPQQGPRQFGVDFAAVGASPKDGVEEVLMFVIKPGDVGRAEWSQDKPTSIRPSLTEALEVYIPKHLSERERSLRKVVVFAITGDMKQEVEQNWLGFVERNKSLADVVLWDGSTVAELLERHMLDEHIFIDQDRQDLRKALALAADRDYEFGDLLNLLRRQLGLAADGTLAGTVASRGELLKSLRRVSLASAVCSHWAAADGNTMQALWVAERSLLWAWHRLQLAESSDRESLLQAFESFYSAHQEAGAAYFHALQPRFYLPDGMAGYCSHNPIFTLNLYEHIGHLAALGLTQLLRPSADDQRAEESRSAAVVIADALCNLINNNGACASPRLDRHVVEISLALILLYSVGFKSQADDWLRNLVSRFDFTHRIKKHFPIGTDSLDDLIEYEEEPESELYESLTEVSWMVATLASWCALRKLDRSYSVLTLGLRDVYSHMHVQLWHPTADWAAHWYFHNPTYETGDTEVPFSLPDSAEELRSRLKEFVAKSDYEWHTTSRAREVGIWAYDFVACRHFSIPVPANFWMRLLAET